MRINGSHVKAISEGFLKKNYSFAKKTPKMHEEIWQLCCSDKEKVAIAAPRGHAKTTAVSGAFVIASLVTKEKRYVVIIADTEDQASEFLMEIKRELEDNEELRQAFHIKKLWRDTQTDIICQFQDGDMFRVLAKGAGQKVRGRKWRGTRPDMYVMDDLENEELVESELRREKMRRWFSGSVMPGGSDDCIFRYVGTILHFDSLLERRMPKDSDPNTVKEELRTYNLIDREWAAVKYKAHNEDFSEILWPEKFSRERLQAIRRDYTEQGVPDVYSQEYLNVPISDDNAYFESRDFIPMKPEDFDRTGLHFYAAADLAISESDKAAFTVLTVGALDSDHNIQIRDIFRGRWDTLSIIERIFEVQQRYQPEIFWIEKENIARSIGPVLEKEMRSRGIYINIETVVPSKDKTQRARPLQARMRAGAMRFPKEADWYIDLETEFRRFPKGAYMDQVDAVGLLAHGINEMIEPLTASELYDQEYWEELGETYDITMDGRDADTGY